MSSSIEKIVAYDDWNQFSERMHFTHLNTSFTKINGTDYKITVYERDHGNDTIWKFKQTLKAIFFTAITFGFCLCRAEGRNLWSSVYYAKERIGVKEQIIQQIAQECLQKSATENLQPENQSATNQANKEFTILQTEEETFITVTIEEYSTNSNVCSTELEPRKNLQNQHSDMIDSLEPISIKVKDPALLIAQQVLEKGIDISAEVIEKLKLVIPKLGNSEENEEFHIIARRNVTVFQLSDQPDLIFKIGRDLDQRFDNTVKGKHVCIENNLDRLVIPHTKKIEIEAEGKRTLIVEEKLDVNGSESYQEVLYEKYSHLLDETLRQLAVFVIKTSFSDVNYRNIPLINSSINTTPQIALFDLEEMNDEYGNWVGLFGRGEGRGNFGDRRLGVIGCTFSKQQMEMLFELAHENAVKMIWEPPVMECKEGIMAIRLKALAADAELKQFYAEKNISTGLEPLQVDLSTLNLDLSAIKTWTDHSTRPRTIRIITQRQAVEEIVKYINHLIFISKEDSVKAKRFIHIQTSFEPDEYEGYIPCYSIPFENEGEKKAWTDRIGIYSRDGKQGLLENIIDALVEARYIAKRIDLRNEIYLQV